METSKVDQTYYIFESLMRQFPLWPSTFSPCECGRMSARGSGKCYLCYQEMLAKEVGEELAQQAVWALRGVQSAWFESKDKLEEK